MGKSIFSTAIYRLYNADLCNFTDLELIEHYTKYSYEKRIYGETNTTTEFLSMRWLRGSGLEVGAGGKPTPLFGNASTIMADCDESLVFGGANIDLLCSIDDTAFGINNKGRFDFVVASHVLEHTDSILRSIENLMTVTKDGGIIYIVLPDINHLHDKDFLPYFGFDHHLHEYEAPLRYSDLHDSIYLSAVGQNGIDIPNPHANLSSDYKEHVRAGKIEAKHRFIHHKHNYDLCDWMDILMRARYFFKSRFRFTDVRYGHERKDCHFIIQIR